MGHPNIYTYYTKVWGHYKNETELISWTSCSMWDEGDLVSWNRVQWKTQDLSEEEVTMKIKSQLESKSGSSLQLDDNCNTTLKCTK